MPLVLSQLPDLSKAALAGKKIVLRADLDVAVENGKIIEEARLEGLLPTLSFLLEKEVAQILLIGHRGRPEGKENDKFTLKPLENYFVERLTPDICFIPHQAFSVFFQVQEQIFACNKKVILLENLRFWPEEEQNNTTLAEQLAYGYDVFVNDAFASSHRAHASIVGIPHFLPSYIGLAFQKEIEQLAKVFTEPKKPVLAIISGMKKDKLEYIEKFKSFSDKILIAGRLPEFFPEDEVTSDYRLMVARLNPDKEDITIHSIEKFEEEISKAGTIIISGPPSHWEDPGHKLGTERVLLAVSKSHAFKVAGGGDTTAAIKHFHLEHTFDWVSSGGGASLDFLANRTLPGIEAILSSKRA